VQTLYHNVVLVAAVCLGAWAICWRRNNGRVALEILLVAILSATSLLPYAQNLVATAGTSTAIRTGVELLRFFSSYRDTLGFPFTGYLYVWVALAVIVIVRAAAGFWGKPIEAADASEDDLSLFASITLVLVAIGFPIFFWRAQMPMQSWYLLPFLASVAVCFDAALPAFRGLFRPAFFGFVIATALVSLATTGRIVNRHFSDINLFAQELNATAGPQDYIIVSPWTCGITFNHYFTDTTPWDTLPPVSDHSVHRFDLFQSQTQNTNALAPVLQKISHTLQSGHHIWILKCRGASSDPYSRAWDSQTMHFIATHSSDLKEFQNPSTEIYITESATLLMASGWTNSSVH